LDAIGREKNLEARTNNVSVSSSRVGRKMGPQWGWLSSLQAGRVDVLASKAEGF
jgi:hypothetical protein